MCIRDRRIAVALSTISNILPLGVVLKVNQCDPNSIQASPVKRVISHYREGVLRDIEDSITVQYSTSRDSSIWVGVNSFFNIFSCIYIPCCMEGKAINVGCIAERPIDTIDLSNWATEGECDSNARLCAKYLNILPINIVCSPSALDGHLALIE